LNNKYFGPGDIDCVSSSGSVSYYVAIRFFRLEREDVGTMQGNVQYTWIFFKHPLDSVAVVYIPIDDKDSG